MEGRAVKTSRLETGKLALQGLLAEILARVSGRSILYCIILQIHLHIPILRTKNRKTQEQNQIMSVAHFR